MYTCVQYSFESGGFHASLYIPYIIIGYRLDDNDEHVQYTLKKMAFNLWYVMCKICVHIHSLYIHIYSYMYGSIGLPKTSYIIGAPRQPHCIYTRSVLALNLHMRCIYLGVLCWTRSVGVLWWFSQMVLLSMDFIDI